MTTLLFLGAGASQPFGIPTMTQMVTMFEESLKKENAPEVFLYNQIKEKLQKGFETSRVDIESVFSVIHGIAEGLTSKDMGPFAYYYIQQFGSERTFSENDIKDAKKLKTRLEIFIKDVCKLNKTDEEKLIIFKNSYDPLYKNIPDLTKQTNSRGFDYYIAWKTYTTNYDLIFEDYWAELAPFIDFFQIKESQFAYFDSTKGIGNQQSFVKLHGSLDWLRLDDGNIIKTNPDSFTRIKKKGEAMLYPIQQKDLYLNPWITLFQELKNGLQVSDSWYVIGYAFNDEFVMEIFLEALTQGKRMIIINPHAKDLIKKFPEKYHQYITPLPIKFGNEHFPKQFEDFCLNQRTLLCKVKTTSQLIGFKSNFRILGAEVVETDKVKRSGTALWNAERSWIKMAIRHSGDKQDIHCVIRVEHNSPYDEDLELVPMFNGVYDYDISIDIQDQFRASGHGNTSEQDQDSQLYLGKPIKIYANDLLL